MKITELIVILEREMTIHGDIEVYVDEDYGQREIDCPDPLCPSLQYEPPTSNMPERLVL